MKRHRIERRCGLAAKRGEQGFALLEVLAAFVLLAIGLGTISAGIAMATRSDVRTKSSTAALMLAQSKLEMAGIVEPLVPGERAGRIGRRFRWQQTTSEIRPRAAPAAAQSGEGEQPLIGPRTYWVSVTVEGADGLKTTLAALKIASRAQP